MNIVLRNRVPLSRSFGPASFDQLVGSMFDDLLTANRRNSAAADSKTLTPRINVSESANAYEVEAELPGVAKEDVRISVDGNRVSFEAEVIFRIASHLRVSMYIFILTSWVSIQCLKL